VLRFLDFLIVDIFGFVKVLMFLALSSVDSFGLVLILLALERADCFCFVKC
jgi:hypothetical protein